MDVIIFLLKAAVWIFAVGVVVVAFVVGSGVLFVAWPAMLGVGGGIYLWMNGSDNAGVICIILGIFGNFVWVNVSGNLMSKNDGGGSSYDPMDDKVALYDSDGDLIGYKDRE